MRLPLMQVQVMSGHLRDEPVTVEAEGFGLYAVHRSAFGRNGWTVTHVPSGLAFAHFTTAGAARLCAWAAREACSSSFWASAQSVSPRSDDGSVALDLIRLWEQMDARFVGPAR